MSFLKNGKTIKAERLPVVADPIVVAREKVCGSIDEQLACAVAVIAKKAAPTKTVIKYCGPGPGDLC
ncbi:MAG: hypothetical protein MN733_40420 [Nitrososphaera sp.]|nr:hypothetical protein [Nitrososphaera sp.]